MRRAMRHGKKLGFKEPFLFSVVDVLVREMGDFYPELRRNRDSVVQVVRSEEERFDAVLTSGLPRLEEVLDRAAAGGGGVPGDEIFKLYDSFGVPLDFIEDMAEQRKLRIDRAGYERAMEGQREKARAASSFGVRDLPLIWRGKPDLESVVHGLGKTPFDGYEATAIETEIVCLLQLEITPHAHFMSEASRLDSGAVGYAILKRTPFYLESGGQVSDRGLIRTESGQAVVEDVEARRKDGPTFHKVRVTGGHIRPGCKANAEVDVHLRDATRRNHTATHLLHAALRQVLGTHVKQAGSLVSPDRLRFDFVHFGALTDEEVQEIERLVNEQIHRNTPVATEVKSTDEAIAAGAMALFGEKYGDRVRVVSVPGFSQELCGGTHCRATGDIGFFTITEESGVAAGVRRIEALTGAGAVSHHQQRRQAFDHLLATLATSEDQAAEAVKKLHAEVKRFGRENEQLKMKLALGADTAAQRNDTLDVGGVKMIARKVSGLDKGPLRGLADSLRDRLQSGVVVLASEHEGKVLLVVSVSKDLTGRIQAGRIVKEIAPLVGGGGGGRPDFAEAGGKNPGGIDELIAKSPDVVRAMLGK
jgi:alanyl-tRNA synthetase